MKLELIVQISHRQVREVSDRLSDRYYAQVLSVSDGAREAVRKDSLLNHQLIGASSAGSASQPDTRCRARPM